MCTRTHTHTHAWTRTHTRTHTHTQHTHAHTHTHLHVHTQKTHTYTHIQSNLFMFTDIHTQIHTAHSTFKVICSCTHIHTLNQMSTEGRRRLISCRWHINTQRKHGNVTHMTPGSSNKVPDLNVQKDGCIFNGIATGCQMDVTVACKDRRIKSS